MNGEVKWNVSVPDCVIEADVPWELLKRAGYVEAGAVSAQFWRPSRALECAVEQVEKLLGGLSRRAIDLGSGTGRDAVFLAMRGWRVTAVDKQDLFLQRTLTFADRALCSTPGQPFAERHRLRPGELQDRVTVRQADLRQQFLLSGDLHVQLGNVDLVNLARFMNRPLLALISERVHVGACVVLHHFVTGATSRTGKAFRKDGQTLAWGELGQSWFAPPTWRVLIEQHDVNVDGVRPMVIFAAQKIA
jgi:hypothetical protein